MLRAFLLPALLLTPLVCSGNNERITMTSTSSLRAESAMYHPTNANLSTGASSIRCTYLYYTNTSTLENGSAYSYADAVEEMWPSAANAFENVNAAGKSICPSRKDHRIEYVTVDMYPTPQQQEDNNYSPYSPYSNYSNYSPYSNYGNYSPYNNYSNYTPSNTYSNYATYSPALTMVGANSVALIATTAGSSPYSNSPSRAPGITNIQRGIFDNGFGYDDDINRDPESPVGEAWSLLFLAAGYAWYTLAKRKKQQQTIEKG